MKNIIKYFVMIILLSACTDSNNSSISLDRPDGNGEYQLSEIVLENVKDGKKIQAIKEIRTETGMGLAD